MAIIGAKPYDIAFIRHDIVEFILTKKPFDCRIAFPLFLSCFDGNGQIIATGKSETQKYVRYGRSHPVNGGDIHRFESAQVKAFVIIRGRIIGFSPIIEIPNIMHRDLVTVNGKF